MQGQEFRDRFWSVDAQVLVAATILPSHAQSMPGGQKANTYGCVLPGAAASARPPYVGVS